MKEVGDMYTWLTTPAYPGLSIVIPDCALCPCLSPSPVLSVYCVVMITPTVGEIIVNHLVFSSADMCLDPRSHKPLWRQDWFANGVVIFFFFIVQQTSRVIIWYLSKHFWELASGLKTACAGPSVLCVYIHVYIGIVYVIVWVYNHMSVSMSMHNEKALWSKYCHFKSCLYLIISSYVTL